MIHHFTPARMAIIRERENNKHGQEHEEVRIHIYGQWVYKMAQPSCKTARHTMKKVKVKAAQSCLTLCDLTDYIYIVHGILQTRILEWVAFPFSRGSSQPRDQTIRPRNSTPRYIPLKSERRDSKRYLYTSVYFRIIHNSQKGRNNLCVHQQVTR